LYGAVSVQSLLGLHVLDAALLAACNVSSTQNTDLVAAMLLLLLLSFCVFHYNAGAPLPPAELRGSS
jgi:hypothetical protein